MGDIRRNMKRRMLRTKIALNQTIQKVLDINRRRKQLGHLGHRPETEQAMREELRVLNRMAEKQALMLKWYERTLGPSPANVQDDMAPPGGPARQSLPPDQTASLSH